MMLVAWNTSINCWIVKGRPFSGAVVRAVIRPENPSNFLVIYEAERPIDGVDGKAYYIHETEHPGSYKDKPGFSYTSSKITLTENFILVG